MNAVPTVLDVGGSFFEPTHKYTSSAAMLLDTAEGWDDQTGEVDWVYHIRAFYSMDVADAYKLVSEYVEQEAHLVGFTPPSWLQARQMIDILAEGSNWLLYTNSLGFVTARCFETLAEAKDTFRIDDEAYSAWLSEDESEV